MSPSDGSCHSYLAASEAISEAQESISDLEILDSIIIRDEEHCKMGNRQVKVCI